MTGEPVSGDVVAVEAFGTVVEVRDNGDVVLDLEPWLLDGKLIRPGVTVRPIETAGER